MLYIMMHFLHYTLLYSLPTAIYKHVRKRTHTHTHTHRKTFPQTPTKDIHTLQPLPKMVIPFMLFTESLIHAHPQRKADKVLTTVSLQ